MAYTNSSMINMMVYLWKMVMFHSRPWTTTRGTPWKTSSSSQQVLQNTILGWTAQSSFWFHCQTVYCCNKIVGRTWWLVGWQEILSFKPMDQISCWSFYPWAWTGWFERWELWIKLKKKACWWSPHCNYQRAGSTIGASTASYPEETLVECFFDQIGSIHVRFT